MQAPPSARRDAFRRLLCSIDGTIQPASVYDATSGRLAEASGYELMVLAGSVASHVVLGAPDNMTLTLTELAEQCRRITRVTTIPLLVDGDNGYGNALNVVRTVQDLEAVGVSGVTIEDSVLPERFGTDGTLELITTQEMEGKLRAAVRSRVDIVIIARCGALRTPGGMPETLERVRQYSKLGVDGIMVVGVQTVEQLALIAEAASPLPLILGGASSAVVKAESDLRQHKARVVFRGHAPYLAALRAAGDTLKAMRDNPNEAVPKSALPPPAMLSLALGEDDAAQIERMYLRATL